MKLYSGDVEETKSKSKDALELQKENSLLLCKENLDQLRKT